MQKINVKDITLSEFLKLSEEGRARYRGLFRFGDAVKAEDTLGAGPLGFKTYGQVKDGLHLFSQKNTTFDELVKYFSRLTRSEEKDIFGMSVFKFMSFYNYMNAQVSAIYENEKAQLQGRRRYSSEEIHAGAEGFGVLGPYLQYRILAGGDVTKIRQVAEVPYLDALAELKYRVLDRDYKAEIRRIQEFKAKQNANY